MTLRHLSLVLAAALVAAGCSNSPKPKTTATRASRPASRPARVVHDTVQVRDSDAERRVARLELRVIEKEAQVEDLQSRLEETRAEVVRAMAKLKSAASRAEAASGMAEAEVALQSLRSSGAQSSDAAPVAKLVRQSASEFDRENYGGALYLANQAKAAAASARGAAADAGRGARAGETAFALPIRLKVASRGNVREGPGTGFIVVFGVEPGTVLNGLSYADEWVRVADDGGRSGWIFRTLVTRP